MPVIYTGMNGTIYEGFPHPPIGPWGLPWCNGYPHFPHAHHSPVYHGYSNNRYYHKHY
ncbi:hypothetical protein ACFYKX_04780 [Cytobacillus sp. FJAT-54145]|uniref:Spore coat protein n=1 Tax=Cytobacillus spartinae TaxID=3299023 RepID=A0ABW6K9I7_9BACI